MLSHYRKGKDIIPELQVETSFSNLGAKEDIVRKPLRLLGFGSIIEYYLLTFKWFMQIKCYVKEKFEE